MKQLRKLEDIVVSKTYGLGAGNLPTLCMVVMVVGGRWMVGLEVVDVLEVSIEVVDSAVLMLEVVIDVEEGMTTIGESLQGVEMPLMIQDE